MSPFFFLNITSPFNEYQQSGPCQSNTVQALKSPNEKNRVPAFGKLNAGRRQLGFSFRKQENMGSVVSHLIRPLVSYSGDVLGPKGLYLHLILLSLTVACDTYNYAYL